MSDIEFNRYNNIVIFAKEWRKYKMISDIMTKDQFRKSMQAEQFVKMEFHDHKKDRTIFIYLFDKSSKYVLSSPDMKKLLKRIKDPCHLILITYLPFNVYHRKVINSQKHLTIKAYRHEIFDLVLPNGPLCYPHRVMSRDEVIKLTNEDLCCYVVNLPKILDEDPQCIWIGAEVGDVIEINMLSDITGEAYQYRVVVPKSGKVVAYKEAAVEAVDVDADAEDDEVQEHRENKEIDDDADEIDEVDEVDE